MREFLAKSPRISKRRTGRNSSGTFPSTDWVSAQPVRFSRDSALSSKRFQFNRRSEIGLRWRSFKFTQLNEHRIDDQGIQPDPQHQTSDFQTEFVNCAHHTHYAIHSALSGPFG